MTMPSYASSLDSCDLSYLIPLNHRGRTVRPSLWLILALSINGGEIFASVKHGGLPPHALTLLAGRRFIHVT